MSEQTYLLGLPYIMPSQAQKHVTHNEALRLLDAVVQLSVGSRTLTEPPETPAEGDRHIIADGAGGEWSGEDGRIAAFQDGAWAVLTPQEGWLAWVADEQKLVCHTEGAWIGVEKRFSELQNLSLLGLGTAADATNPFAAKLNKALWSARYASEGGDGDLRLKVSADGTSWNDALVADRVTGSVSLPGGLTHSLSGARLNGLLFTPGGDGTISIWRLNAAHAQNPRTATVSFVSGDTVSLSAAVANQFFESVMTGVSHVRIWNVGKSPAQSAWIKASPTSSSLKVTDAAAVSAWTEGDTIQIGDPTAATPGRVIAIDISPMLQTLFGTVFRQSGIMVKAFSSGMAGSDGLTMSPTGAAGSFVSCATAGANDGVTVMPCTELSPISNSNLIFIQETIATTATVEIISSLGVFA